MDKHRIVVIGAGYAGLMAALRLGGRTRRTARVTLINAADTFVERIRLHQIATGQPTKRRAIANIAAWRGVAFLQGRVTGIQLAAKTLTVNTPSGVQTVAYDTLVYALGSIIERDRVPGVREYAYTLSPDGERGAAALATRLRELPDGSMVTVVGGGLTGIEAVTESAEMYPALRFTLVTRGPVGESVSETSRAHIRQVMVRLGIAVIEGRAVTSVHADKLQLDDGRTLPHAVVLWAGAFGVPALAREAGLAVNTRGLVIVDEYQQSVSHADVYAVGDCAAAAPVSGVEPRMSCQSAMPQGTHAAEVIAARLHGREPQPFRFGFIAQCVSLGRRDAVLQFVRYDDAPTGPMWTGRRAALIKELVCRFTVWSILAERFAPVAWWRKTGAQRQAAHAAAR